MLDEELVIQIKRIAINKACAYVEIVATALTNSHDLLSI